MHKVFEIVGAFFLYVLKSMPVVAVVAVALFFSREEFQTPDFQMNIPAQEGKHKLNMGQGFTRARIGPDGNVYIVDEVFCKTHQEDEVLIRPVGYWEVRELIPRLPFEFNLEEKIEMLEKHE